MAIFPKIQSPCPYKSQLATVMEGDFCRQCKRNVVDLSPLSDGERMALLAGCETEVCVIYRLPLKPALAAAALAASVAALPAAAQDVPVAAAAIDDSAIGTEEFDDIFVGGIKDVKNIEFVEDAADAAMPDLPVIDDDAPAAPAPVAR